MARLLNYSVLTPYLLFCVCLYLQGALLFGIDTGSFGSLQALPSFLRRFGEETEDGDYALPTSRKAIMNSVPWIGKILGCVIIEPLIDRFGYRVSMIITCWVQIVALIIEMTSKEWIQFTIGRNFAYTAVGLVENLVPAYCAEVAPSALRGLLAGSITFVVAIGNLWGSGMSRAFVNHTDDIGWLVPCGMQLIPAVVILALILLTPESPRWLLLKGDKPLALHNLHKLRTKAESANGFVAAEVDAIEQAIAEGYAQDSGTWRQILTDPSNYGRRAWIVASLFIFQQTNGNQFVNSYGPTFYKESGYGDASFTYAMIGQAMTIVGCAIGILLTDYTGRRPLMYVGGFMCGILLSIGAALGSQSNPTTAAREMVIASFLLLCIFTKLSASNNAFLIGAEIGGVMMRKKILAFGTGIDVLAAFLVTFTTPYLLASDPGPNLGPKIGWIFAAAGYLSGFFGIFFTPELKGRSLEEVDELFEAKIHCWQFSKYKTTGVGHRVGELEQGDHEALEEQVAISDGPNKTSMG